MKIEVSVPDYSPEQGLRLEWDYGFMIIVQVDNGAMLIKANQAGLVSLARHLLTLAEAQVPPGYHLHFDASNSLEEGSCELIVEKM